MEDRMRKKYMNIQEGKESSKWQEKEAYVDEIYKDLKDKHSEK